MGENLSTCKNCGNEVSEEMAFCPKCGAPLRATVTPTVRKETKHIKSEKIEEKEEKHEKHEKAEKEEKYEKSEFSFIGLIIGGLILIIIGFTSYLQITGIIDVKLREILWAVFLIAIGIILILGAFYAMTAAKKRNPVP
jgi:cation transport ATPase